MNKNSGITIGTLRKQRLNSLKSSNEVFGQINECLSDLYSYDQVMTEWLARSEDNKIQFLNDPIGTFKMVASPTENTIKLLEVAQKWSESEKDFFYDSFLKQDALSDENRLFSKEESSVTDWDIIASIKISEVNKIIKWAFIDKKIPELINHELIFSAFSSEVKLTISIRLDIPKIIGGTGSMLEVCFPIKEGVLSCTDLTHGTQWGPWKLELGAKVNLQMNLKQVEACRKNTFEFYLVFHSDYINNIVITGLPEEAKEVIGTVIDNGVKTALTKEYGNHSILICRVSSELVQKYSFLLPKEAYCIFTESAVGIENSALSIVANTVTSSENMTFTIDKNVIPTECDATVKVSDLLFMQYILLPTLNARFGVTDEDPLFEILSDTGDSYLTIRNKRSFNLEKQGGYTPQVKKFTVCEHDGRLHIDIDVTVSPSKGIYLNYTSKGTYTIEFEQLKSGGQKLVLKKETYESSHTTHVDDWVWVVAALAGIATAFLALIGPLAIGISESIVAIIAAIVDTKAPNGIDPGVITSAVDTVRWGHTDLLAFTGATVNDDGVCLGMNINFTDKL